jgi:hypothetical protein
VRRHEGPEIQEDVPEFAELSAYVHGRW